MENDADTMWFEPKENYPHGLDSDACYARAESFLKWLVHAEELPGRIAAFSHWVFLKHTLVVLGLDGKRMGNAEPLAVRVCSKDSASC